MNKKKFIIFLFFLISVISIIFIPETKSKYTHKIENNLLLESTKFYFNNTASDLTISYDEVASFTFNINNYTYAGFTEKDITYNIEWTNNTYGLKINDEDFNYTNFSKEFTLIGGQESTKNIKIGFIPINEIPVEEKLTLKICSTKPYKKCEEFNINIVSPDAFNVVGNATEWTTNDVTLKIVPDEKNSQIEYCSFDDGLTWEQANYNENIASVCSKTFSENQLVKIKVKNYDGTESDRVNIDITKIDREAPNIIFDNISEELIDETLIVTLNESNSIFTKMNCEDAKSGIKDVSVTIDGVEITNTNLLTEVGRYTVEYTATDNLGNETSIYREILVRWPLAGKYILARQNTIGTGLATEEIGSGLYEDDESTAKDTNLSYASKYYYSGKEVNNYIQLPNTSSDKESSTTWRIINIAENDSLKILTNNVLNDKYTLSNTAINRWKVHKMAFFTSTISDWTSSGYIGDNEYYVDFSDSGYVDNAIFYIGAVYRRGTNSNDSSTYLEVIDERNNTSAYETDYNADEALSMLSWQSKIGIINVTDTTKSSNSAKVFSIRSMQENQSAFEKTSWMYNGETEWSINACSSQSNQFWRLESNQFLSKLTSNIYKGAIRPVIYLKNDTILSGTGNESDPFIVQNNWEWFDNQYPSKLYDNN